MSRSAGRGFNENNCTASTANGVSNIQSSLWHRVASTYAGIRDTAQVGDIMEFDSHAAYVSNVIGDAPRTDSDITLMFIDGPSEPTPKTKSLAQVLAGSGCTQRNQPHRLVRRDTVSVNLINSFSGGHLKKNATRISAGSHSVVESQVMKLEPEHGQSDGSDLQIFKNWTMVSTTKYGEVQYEISTVNCTYRSNFEDAEYLTVTNATGADSVIALDITYAVPCTLAIGPDWDVTVTAIDHTTSGMSWAFEKWTQYMATYYTRTATFNPVYDGLTATAHFKGKPTKVTGVQITSSIGENVSFSWSEHPNSNVTYRIYRKPKYGSPTYVTSKSHGTTTFTDPLYEHTTSVLGDLMYWDIRAYYDTDDMYADEKWYALYGRVGFKRMADGASGIPTEFSVGNFPNPFNPKTAINISLPVRSDVTLSIYDMRGREIQQHALPNSAAGRYTIEWDASDAGGVRVPSGVYLYRLVASPKDGSAAFVQTRKMLLLK
ncbi:FlgD immunoglobulin-like domain containing protein [Candidatus Neomarinimicrobiota bacterium]